MPVCVILANRMYYMHMQALYTVQFVDPICATYVLEQDVLEHMPWGCLIHSTIGLNVQSHYLHIHLLLQLPHNASSVISQKVTTLYRFLAGGFIVHECLNLVLLPGCE